MSIDPGSVSTVKWREKATPGKRGWLSFFQPSYAEMSFSSLAGITRS